MNQGIITSYILIDPKETQWYTKDNYGLQTTSSFIAAYKKYYYLDTLKEHVINLIKKYNNDIQRCSNKI